MSPSWQLTPTLIDSLNIMLTKAPGTTPTMAAHPNASQGSRRSGLSMLLGLALLVTGCWVGLAEPRARTLVLCLLSTGIAMFAASLVLLRHRPLALHSLHPMASARADPVPVELPAAKPGGTLIVKPVAAPLENAAAAPAVVQELPRPLVATAAEIHVSSKPSEAALDLAALIDAPLADLLLAALCKDPVGARRIFAKALESAASPEASAGGLVPPRAVAP